MYDSDPLEAFFKATFDKMGEIVGSSLERVKQKWDAPNVAAAYKAKMLILHGTTRILGKPDPVKLDNIFTDVHIWNKPEATRLFTEDELEAAYRAGDRQRGLKRHEGVSVVEQHKRLFILGKPGAGKSTLMKWVAGLVAKGELMGIPIFITLKEMADANRTVWQQIIHQLELCNVPNAETFGQTLLNSGNAVVLFDGLDEVPGEERQQDKVIDDIRDFVQKYESNRYLITCRTAALTYAFNDFTYVEVANFTPAQIETYITRYFDKEPKQAEACLAELKQEKYRKLQQLATSPLLLSLFCLNYEQSGTFPPERVDLYEEALLALLTRWNGERNLRPKSVSPYGQFSVNRRTQLYSTLAYQNFRQGASFIKAADLNPQIEAFLQTVPGIPEIDLDGAKVLRDMEAQHGIIVERARNVHAFSHLTFQEYYTAKYIADNQATGTLDDLMPHIADPRWREVFLLTASLLSQADIFFVKFLAYLDTLAASIPTLSALLKYAAGRSHRYSGVTPVDARLWVVQVTLSATIARVLDLALVRDLVRDLDLALIRVRALDRALTLALDPDLRLARDLARDLKDLDSATRLDALCFTLCHAVGTTEILPLFINPLARTAAELGLTGLARAYANLELPTGDKEESNGPAWETFRRQIGTLAHEHCGLRLDQEISWQESNRIDGYLTATTLLTECLKVAVVTDRETIKARLLLPNPS